MTDKPKQFVGRVAVLSSVLLLLSLGLVFAQSPPELSFTGATLGKQWEQLGADIDGEAAGDGSGRSISLSADGLTVAFGATRNDGSGEDSGHTRIYRYNGVVTEWQQLGGDIDGEVTGDGSGESVSLSADGLTIAIGARFNDGTGLDAGHTRIYRYDGVSAQWEQLGADIDGEAAGDNSGGSVSLSADGLIVAIGAFGNGGIGDLSGHTRVYRYDNVSTQWEQLGADIDGEAADDFSGGSVSLSMDGLTVAIGASRNDGNGFNSGHTRIYRYDDVTSQWEQLGADIDGEAASDSSGESVSLSADGLTVVIGARLNEGNGFDSGHARIYRFNETLSQWDQFGEDIDGEAGDRLGVSVSLSADGFTVAIGAAGKDEGTGRARIYRYNTASLQWEQFGADIDGEAVGDFSGESVCLSAEGLVTAVGAFFNDGNGQDSGHARIYRLDPTRAENAQFYTILENTTPVTDVIASDDLDSEEAGLSYWLSGVDASFFTISSTGELAFKSAPDYEMPSSADDDNAYDLIVNVNDSEGLTASQGLTITVIDVNDFPALTGETDVNLNGNESGSLDFILSGSDDLGGLSISASSDNQALISDASLIFTGSGGERSLLINPASGQVGTATITLTLSDGVNTITKTFVVTVVNQAPELVFDGATLTGFWEQLGADIDGEAVGDRSGDSVSVSADGFTVAIGANHNDGNGRDSGQTRIYHYDEHSAEWEQLGADIDGEAVDDESGTSVSLSADGFTVAIGANHYDGNWPNFGQTRIYRYDEHSTEWEQLGADIDGEAAGDGAGNSVSLSADGLTVAIGANRNGGNGSRSGHTRIYRYNEAATQWEQLGADIDGEAAGDNSGGSVSLSADGFIVAIGAPGNDGSDYSSGHTRVYRYDNVSSQWEQLGADIDGEAFDNFSGGSVSLSADGSTVAVGARGNDGNGSRSGHVRIYRYHEVENQWEQFGADFDGEAAGDTSGGSVSLSADGRAAAIGATGNEEIGFNSGHARIYRYHEVEDQWEQLGADFDGEAAGDFSGGSVSLNADGFTVAIGATGNDGNGNSSGHTRIYRFNSRFAYWIPESTTSITDVSATDDIGAEGAGLLYSLSGVDAPFFTINVTGELSFVNPPDYEMPSDDGADNVYDFIVNVTDSEGLSDSQALSITIVDVPPLLITEHYFDVSGQMVTLSWNSLLGKSYRVRYSPDLENWNTVIGTALTSAQDENPGKPNELTMTFDLSGLIPLGTTKGFFRVEEEF